MESADKLTQVNAHSVQSAIPVVPPVKLGSVAQENGKSEKQSDNDKSVKQTGELEIPTRKEAEDAVKEISDFVQNIQRNLNFSVHDDTGLTIIKVTDRETDKMIRQIPAEEIVELQKFIHDASGILFKAKV